MSYLLTILKYWKFIGIGILILIIGIEYHMLNNRDSTIIELNNTIANLNTIIHAKDESIESYEKKMVDDDAKITSVNDQLNHCLIRLNTQINDMLAIDDIMNSTDEPVVEPAVPDTPVTEVKSHATSTISNTTQTKGIDFINSQFDSIK